MHIQNTCVNLCWCQKTSSTQTTPTCARVFERRVWSGRACAHARYMKTKGCHFNSPLPLHTHWQHHEGTKWIRTLILVNVHLKVNIKLASASPYKFSPGIFPPARRQLVPCSSKLPQGGALLAWHLLWTSPAQEGELLVNIKGSHESTKIASLRFHFYSVELKFLSLWRIILRCLTTMHGLWQTQRLGSTLARLKKQSKI